MSWLRQAVAFLAGLAASGICIQGIEWLSSILHPKPEGLDITDWAAVEGWMQELPATAFLMIVLAWGVGSFVGAYLARRAAFQRSLIPALLVVASLATLVVVNLLLLPHPAWMWPAGILVSLGLGGLGIVAGAPTSYQVKSTQLIAAPLEQVFQTIANPENFAKAVPGIEKIEFLTEQRQGLGTRFRETRTFRGKQAATELAITEMETNATVRMVSDEGGTIWDTIFRVEAQPSGTRLQMKMDARPYQFMARVITPLILKMIANAVEQDMQSVKTYCQSQCDSR